MSEHSSQTLEFEALDRAAFGAAGAAAAATAGLCGGRARGSLPKPAGTRGGETRGIKTGGGSCPPYRDLTEDEERDLLAQIDADQPDVLWIGTGVPRQEKWMAHIRPHVDVP